jgi:predicted nucleotidyltransferase
MTRGARENLLLGDLSKARTTAREFADGVRRRFGERVKRVRLFGSAARGDWRVESDVDVLILLDRVESGDMDWIVREATSAGILRSGILIQPLVMPESEFERLKRQERRFAMEVEKTGVDP